MTHIKQEVQQLGSRYLDQTLMYPGKYIFTWMLVCSVWHLVGMEPTE